MWILKKPNSYKQRVKWWSAGEGRWDKGQMLFKGTNLQQVVSPRYLVHNIVNMDNNIVL